MTGDIQKNCGCMRVGIDVGSTTVKIVVTDISTNKIEYSRYVRHNARQVETARLLLEEAAGHFADGKEVWQRKITEKVWQLQMPDKKHDNSK